MRKDVVLLRNWLQFSEGDRAEIPLDWVAMFMKPDEDIVYMYDNEKEKKMSLKNIWTKWKTMKRQQKVFLKTF